VALTLGGAQNITGATAVVSTEHGRRSMNELGAEPELVRASVFRQLRREILSCELRPGTRLQERELVERLGVSKSPIRDALLKLEEQSLVEVMPRKGYRVRPISISDARELYEMRQILERECVLRLAETAPDPVVAELDRFRAMDGPVELTTWIDYNRRFHIFFADHCGNARLARAARDVIEQFDRLTHVSVTSTDAVPLTEFIAQHGAIIDAVQRRDKRVAATLMRDHVEGSRRRVLGELANASIIA
jgi:DNA-binding GntR family transcriptional regulator